MSVEGGRRWVGAGLPLSSKSSWPRATGEAMHTGQMTRRRCPSRFADAKDVRTPSKTEVRILEKDWMINQKAVTRYGIHSLRLLHHQFRRRANRILGNRTRASDGFNEDGSRTLPCGANLRQGGSLRPVSLMVEAIVFATEHA